MLSLHGAWIGNDFATTSGDRVANNHQHVRGKSLGVETDAMKKYGRNLARAMNQKASSK